MRIISDIKQTILKQDSKFTLQDLFNELNNKGITNRLLIIDVLDELLDVGLVEYYCIKNHTLPIYQVKR